MTSTTNSCSPHTVHYRRDYSSPKFSIDNTNLTFELSETETIVKSVINFQRLTDDNCDLILNGEEMTLLHLRLNDLDYEEYVIDNNTLTVKSPPNIFTLEIVVKINPQDNKSLNGLYLSNSNFATQCEPHGFRRITYYLDRPDILTVFKVKIIADKNKYPILLSNGNKLGSGELDNNKHFVEWHDPMLKPCYLFALVAGDFEHVASTFTTMSGRTVDLVVYVEKGKLAQADFALQSLKDAMAWDERVYKREYDLDIFMIVAVSDFNFGAMENKGLNIFNDQYILAQPELATDNDYTGILGVVGHEYFHNWTGNRITCRDWFQLSLKEGLTVFRDQNFTADMTSGINKRIGDVYIIKNFQFAEDSGPMSHPIRPESYVSMNNFYTTTVYNKGAEVIRMIETILGKDKFFQGMDEYFRKNDGLAVTTDDFVSAMEVGSGKDLTQFRRWYSQAGTPVVKVISSYDSDSKTFKVHLKQYIPTDDKALPLHIPMRFGLLSRSGGVLSYSRDSHDGDIINLVEREKEFKFTNVSEEPVLSLLRNFSAPIKLDFSRNDDDLCVILSHDTDLVNRYDAALVLVENIVKGYICDKSSFVINPSILDAFKACLRDKSLDKEFIAKIFTMPTKKLLLMENKNADIIELTNAIDYLENTFALTFEQDWLRIYQENSKYEPYAFRADQVSKRIIKNTSLSYLALCNKNDYVDMIELQYKNADNMTDKIAALTAITKTKSDKKNHLISGFYDKYKSHPLVIDKWLRIQAADQSLNGLKRIKDLMEHPAYDATNPNRVRALLGVYSSMNTRNFHDISGDSYNFIADGIIRVDKFNPQLAARLCEPFINWDLYDVTRQKLISSALRKIASANGLSKDVSEIVSRSLNIENDL